MVFDQNDKERRIRRLRFFVSDFGAENLTDEEFIQMFVNAYADVPSMSTKRTRKWDIWYTLGEYRNPAKGWFVVYDLRGQGGTVGKSVIVEPIITQTSFD